MQTYGCYQTLYFSTFFFFNLKVKKPKKVPSRVICKSLFHINCFFIFFRKELNIYNILVTLPIKVEVVISKKYSSKVTVCWAASKTLPKKNKGDSYRNFCQFKRNLSFGVLSFGKAYRHSYAERVCAVKQLSYRESPNVLAPLGEKWETD